MTAEQHTRTCKTCNVEKPIEDFPPVISKGKRSLRPHCRACWGDRHGRKARPFLPIEPLTITESRCKTCEKVKPVSAFRINADRKLGRYVVRSECKACWKPPSLSVESRQAERARRAERAGRVYTPAASMSPEGKAAARNETRAKLARAKPVDMRELQGRLCDWAHKAWAELIRTKAPDDVVEAWYCDKPWNNPRLSKSQAFAIRYRADESFAISERMRRQLRKAATNDAIAEHIRAALKREGSSRVVERLLGYKVSDLRQHIESLFCEGMNWSLFMAGKIHIDHIRPKASFDLSDESQWIQCWSISNLQPLWARDNLRKSAKWDGDDDVRTGGRAL